MAAYVNGPGTDEKTAKVEGNKKLYYLQDGSASVHQLLNQGQQAANTELRDAYGNPLFQEVKIEDRFGFAGREEDGESGLVHFRRGAYDPRTGRFLQREPRMERRHLEPYVCPAYGNLRQ